MQMTKEARSIRVARTGFTNGCEPSTWVLVTKPGFSARIVCTFQHRAISPTHFSPLTATSISMAIPSFMLIHDVISLDCLPRVELLGYIKSMLHHQRTLTLFAKVVTPFDISPCGVWGFFSPHPCDCLTFLLQFSQSYLTVVLICISLVANEGEHLFMYLQHLHSYLEEKRKPIHIFCHF